MADAAAPRRVVHFSVFELDFGTGELRKAGLKIKLQEQPFQVLAMLLEHPGELVTREELHARLWPSDTFVDFDHGLNVAVKKLRQALSDSADSPRFIETLARRGYRFIGQAENVTPRATDQSAELQEAPATSTTVLPTPHPSRHRPLPWLVFAVLVAAVGFALWHWWPLSSAPRVVTRFTIALSPSDEFTVDRGGLAISPDGSYLVYSATASKTGVRQLHLRPMDRNEASLIPGTEGAMGPFFSPEGQWIAFTSGGQLKKVPLHGGTPLVLCTKVNRFTGSWGPDGTIFFSEDSGESGNQNGKLMRVPAAGGLPDRITPIEKETMEFGPRWPQVLPTGNAILYVTGGTSAAFSDDATIVAQNLKTGERKTLIQGGTSPRFISTGHLVYARGGSLLAVPFDPRRLEVTGVAFPVAEDIWQGPAGYVAYDVSRGGLLVSLSGGERSVGSRTLNWVDRTGVPFPINTAARQYSQPSVSPDGRKIAVAIGDPLRQSDIWILDLEQNLFRQITFSKAGQSAAAPVWTPDGKRIIYASGAHGGSLFWQAADGSGNEELLFASGRSTFAMVLSPSCSPDCRFLVFQRGDPRDFDLWVLNLSGDRKISPLLASNSTITYPQISPDGRRLAYTSDESGRTEVYVESFPKLGDKSLVSTGGGEEPQWSKNGRQLFYRQRDKMMVADLETKLTPKAPPSRVVFEGQYAHSSFWTNYDLAGDGQRFLMLKEEDPARANQVLRVVLNWTDELKRPTPGRN
jgi:Tol biopolymer transport system component/DNA-binding winged helix-turn-helix (wHTH) protein